MFEQEAWEERYRSRTALWTGRPNRQLVAEAADLAPGTALDVGCGEGADAIWLAARGWQVTAVDISTTALARAATHGDAAGAETAARITWTHTDLRAQPPATGAYDLVSAHYMHLPPVPRRELFAGLAAAVAPGGTLLIVGHHRGDAEEAGRPDALLDAMFTADELATALDGADWTVRAAEDRPRPHTDVDGNPVHVRDVVLVAHRRPAT